MPTEDHFEFTLPALLNIVFRGRWIIAVVTALGLIAGIGYGIVVKPLYIASVQVRPGIVAYTEQGSPLRGWMREDIVHFFNTSTYWQDMRNDERFAGMKAAPIVQATFVPSALQFMSGGDVITLKNLAVDPDLASRTLAKAMESFNRQGEADSLGSDLNLTRKRIHNTIERIQQDIDLVASREEKAALEIKKVEGELVMINYERQNLVLNLKTLADENSWRKRAAENTLAEVVLTRERLASAEKMLEVALATESGSSSGGVDSSGTRDPVGEVLKQTASREQAGRVGDLLLTVSELSSFIYEGSVKADSLQARIMANEQEMERLKLVGELVLVQKEEDVRRTVNDLQISMEKDLPYERAQLKTDLEAENVKLEIISPLEQVGKITASDRPVRPRKLRAAAILTILAFFCGLGLVFVREYFLVNREVIMRPDRG